MALVYTEKEMQARRRALRKNMPAAEVILTRYFGHREKTVFRFPKYDRIAISISWV